MVGTMTFIGNGTTPSRGQTQSQFVAGNVVTSSSFGASGLVTIQNGGSSGPDVTPMGVQLNNVADNESLPNLRRRGHTRRGPAAWIQNIGLSTLFSRQTSSQLAPLPIAQPALAPSVLTGAFWTNTSTSHEVIIIGGNFSFTSSGTSTSQGIAIYDPDLTTLEALPGSQINGTVRSLLVQENTLYVGGEFSLQGTSVDGFAVYDLSTQQWDVSDIQPLQNIAGSTVVVRSITTSSAKANAVIVAGSFAQAGSLQCQAVCFLDTNAKQWNTLGNGIQGEVASVDFAGVSRYSCVAMFDHFILYLVGFSRTIKAP